MSFRPSRILRLARPRHVAAAEGISPLSNKPELTVMTWQTLSKYAGQLGFKLVGEFRRLGPWAVPGVVLGGWMVYPALTDEAKKDMGLPYDPANIPA